MAGGLGFEPRLTEAESAVLPLNYPPPSEAVAMDLRARERSSEMSGERVRGRNAADIRRCARLVHPRLDLESQWRWAIPPNAAIHSPGLLILGPRFRGDDRLRWRLPST